MNKKVIAVLAVALMAVVGTSAFLAITWTAPATATLTINAGSSNSPSVTLVTSCASPAGPGPVFTTYTFPQGFVSGQTYTVTFYVVNTGSQLVYLYYTPGSFSDDGGQTLFNIYAYVIEAGNLQCQMNIITKTPLTVKDPAVCNNAAYALGPTAVAKIQVDITVLSINPSGAPWDIPLTIWGCVP